MPYNQEVDGPLLAQAVPNAQEALFQAQETVIKFFATDNADGMELGKLLKAVTEIESGIKVIQAFNATYGTSGSQGGQ